MNDIESLDDLALRISEECREVVNRRVVEYFGRLIVASGQRRVRVLRQTGGKRGVPTHNRRPPKQKLERKPKAQELIDMLEGGPVLAKEIEDRLGMDKPTLHSLVHYANARVLKGTPRVIRGKRGSMGKGGVYAIRDVDWKEKDDEGADA